MERLKMLKLVFVVQLRALRRVVCSAGRPAINAPKQPHVLLTMELLKTPTPVIAGPAIVHHPRACFANQIIVPLKQLYSFHCQTAMGHQLHQLIITLVVCAKSSPIGSMVVLPKILSWLLMVALKIGILQALTI
jgi:hypothetical protein